MPSPSRPASHKSSQHDGSNIDRLEYRPGGKPLLSESPEREGSGRHSEDRSYAGSFFQDVAEGIADKDRERMKREVIRYASFLWANIACLGAGSITAYSLYAPLFQHRLHYSQLQVNGVSITAELAMYLLVPIFGYLCDRYGPRIPSLLAGTLFGVGYVLAAFTYRSGPPPSAGGEGWPYGLMILCFIPIGSGTACMVFSAVTTCAKNFGRSKYKGLALALPIACFGLSGMWLSQVGSNLLYEPRPNGDKGDVDVFRFFLFLGIFLFVLGVGGFFALQIVDEDELIDEAVEELEQSGLLEGSEVFQQAFHRRGDAANYGSIHQGEDEDSEDEELEQQRLGDSRLQDQRKKDWLLNGETRRFLSDPTMWLLTAGFFLATGPGEAFINNLGTIIGTLEPPEPNEQLRDPSTSAATQVSVVAIASTVSRIFTGTLSDLLAPASSPHQHRRGPNSIANSVNSLSALHEQPKHFAVSRVTFLLTFGFIMSIGQALLASGVAQGHGERFWIVSGSMGAGYGACFSLTPIIVSVIWGVENFGTNWGICATVPAIGATVWGLIYSGVYQWAAELGVVRGSGEADVLCYGTLCYAPTFWAMAACSWVACLLWLWAWRGPGGWASRGIAV